MVAAQGVSHTRAGGRRRGRALALAIAVVAGSFVLLSGALPAAAHGALVASEPADGAVLAASPSEVVLTFSQQVALAPNAVEVTDEAGGRIDVAAAHHPHDQREVVVAPLPMLDGGGYRVAWRVTSDDGDPISGTFSFVVAASPAAGADAAAPPVHLGDPAVVATAGSDLPLVVTVLRFASFTGLMLLVGAGLHVLVLAPARTIGGRGRGMITLSAILLASTAVLGVAAGAAHAGGRAVTAAADPQLLGPFLETTAARSMLIRAVVGTAAIVLVHARLPFAAMRWLGLLTGLGVVGTFATSGHAITGDHIPAAVVADVVHLAAAGVWIGGLASLLVLGGSRDRAITRRFSAIAAGAVAALVVSGSFAVWRQLGQVDRLVATDYGRLVAAKLLLVAALLALGAVSRQAAKRALGARLARSVAAEAAIAVVILAVTAALVGSAPAAEDGSVPSGDQRVLVGDAD